jgi:(R,R)-butanediol dehydrogenase / meso-butanediol dehydrogenase / diacetyl reductase
MTNYWVSKQEVLVGLPELMHAAVYKGPGRVEVDLIAVPDPEPGQVLVEVGHCGVCGSDLHMMIEGWGKPGFVGGHESSGVVAAVGDGVSEWKVGDRVVCGPSPRCGTCRRCLEKKPSQCENRSSITGGDGHTGAFARYLIANAKSLIAVPADMDQRVAALAEPLAVALHGITRSGAVPGDTAMVFGAGPIGALTIAALVAKGMGPVTAVEPGERRKQLALEVGAAVALHPNDLELFAPWEPDKISDRAVDVVLECSGKKAAMEAGLSQLRRGGRLVFVGAGMEAPSFDPNRVLLNELEICGSFVYDADGFERAIELLGSGAMPIDALVDPVDVTLDRLGDALVGLADGSIPGKVMVVPHVSADLPTKAGAPR